MLQSVNKMEGQPRAVLSRFYGQKQVLKHDPQNNRRRQCKDQADDTEQSSRCQQDQNDRQGVHAYTFADDVWRDQLRLHAAP